MAGHQDTQTNTPAGDLNARITAVDQYLTAQQLQSPTSSAPPASNDFTGGTVIHISHVGSFAIPSGSASRAGIAVIVFVIIGALFLFIRRHLHAR